VANQVQRIQSLKAVTQDGDKPFGDAMLDLQLVLANFFEGVE